MIRMIDPGDAAHVAEIYRPYVQETAISFEMAAPDAAEFETRINRCLPDYPWLVAEQDGIVVGYACAGRHRFRTAYQWSVEVSVYIRKNFQRRGIARSLYQSLFGILRSQGFRNALAGTTLPNQKSTAFHKAMGFQEIGTYPDVGYKFGKWHSVLWLIRKLTESETPPHEIKSIDDIVESDSLGQS